ncbi:DUF5642 family protein [Actinophytocola algeriensis]|uniref:PknH-like protein n=1 Tax=Actinophytocola algeriensis TaxID=1768010 RepID=A0A7W7VBX5_9PSEU|nr:DUF5642 family protein [Actinophytocola algeriensis]MBB4904455.1 hypothetical protein [Actinophytocola algeriensis]MBE1476686.1 hypothetical protein [Actinophytocola algeriensis]
MTDEFGIEPRGRRRVLWWVAAVGILVAVVVVSLVRDGDPDDALLTAEDFGGGYDVAAMTAAEFAQSGATDLPEDIEPPECAELLRSRPEPANPELAAGVSARGARTAYLEVVLPADDVSEWDTDRLDEVVGTCGTTTFDDGDTTGTVEFSHLDVPVEDGFALAARVSGSDGVVTLGVAVSRIGEHVVVLTGVAQGDLDEREFSRLVRAAGERVSAHL